jgi:hypothetical protein
MFWSFVKKVLVKPLIVNEIWKLTHAASINLRDEPDIQ